MFINTTGIPLEPRVSIMNEKKLEEEYLTTAQAAALWTQRAIDMGFIHLYKPDSVRQAQKQGRIESAKKTLGTNRLFAKADIEAVDIRPWMRLMLQQETYQHPCARCGVQVPAEELSWRSWYWCAACQQLYPHLWSAYRREHFREEAELKRGLYRESRAERSEVA